MKDLYIDILKNVNGIKAFFSTKHGASNGSPYYHQEALEQLGMVDKILAQPQQVHEAKIGIIGENDCRIIDEILSHRDMYTVSQNCFFRTNSKLNIPIT